MNDFNYISFDPPGVQRLIFQTQKLKEIRAMSAMLEHAGQEELKALIDATQSKPLRLAGGGGAVFVPSQHKDNFLRQLRAIQAHHLPGVPFTIKDLPHPPGNTPADSHREAARLHALPVLSATNLLGPSSMACASCRFAPATHSQSFPDRRTELLCQHCHDKRQGKGYESAYQIRLRTLASEHEWNPQLTFADDLIDIAEQTVTRKQYLALIALDVNRMGQHFNEKLSKLQDLEGCKAFKQHSDDIKAKMVDAAAKAVLATWPRRNLPMVPAEMLYLGGDDAVMICAADRALALARNLAQAFVEDPTLKEFTLSIGVVFARHNTPMHAMIDLGQELVTSAKRRAKTKGQTGSMVDFEVMLSQSSDLEASRKELTLEQEPLKEQPQVMRTAKPYNCAELAILEDSVRALSAMDGRLYDLDAACGSRTSGTLAAIQLLGRMNKLDFDLLTKQFKLWGSEPPGTKTLGYPWTKNFGSNPNTVTLIRDVLELFPFLEVKRETRISQT